MSNDILAGEHRQQEIDQKVAEFLRSGGAINVVKPAWELSKEERVLRQDKGYGTSMTHLSDNSEVHARRAGLVRRATELAKTMTLTRAAEEMKVTRSTLQRLAKEQDIEFRERKGGERRPEHVHADRLLGERIKALRDIGLNQSQAMKQVEVGYEKFQRLIQEQGIDFPVTPLGMRNKRRKHESQ